MSRNFMACRESCLETNRRIMTPRRKVLIALGASSLAPLLSFAQQPPAKPPRVGILSPFNSSSDAFRDAVRQRLQELGYTEGRNIVIEYRASDDTADRLPQLAADLVNLKVEGKEVTMAAPETHRAQVIDLMDALKQSLAKRTGSRDEAPARKADAAQPITKKPPMKAAKRASDQEKVEKKAQAGKK